MQNQQSVHLKARVMVRGEGIIVLLQWLWELRGSMQREGQARQGCLKRVCPRALQGRKANQAHTDARPTKSEWDRSSVKFNPHHSWLGLTEQQNLTLFRGRAWMPEVERPKF